MIWSRDELENLVKSGLSAVEGDLQRRVIEIAETEQPEVAFGLVEETLHNRGFDPREGVAIARSASWLALARREKREWFDHIVAKLSS